MILLNGIHRGEGFFYVSRDWITDENGRGKLSLRMSEPGNLWMSLWLEAPLLPVSMQAPLFDVDQEVEQIILYLEKLSLGQLLSL